MTTTVKTTIRKPKTPKPQPPLEMRVTVSANTGETLYFVKGDHEADTFLKLLPTSLAGKKIHVASGVWRLVRGKQYEAEFGKQGAFKVTFARAL